MYNNLMRHICSALVEHAARLLTLRHDGRGLPDRSALTAPTVALALLYCAMSYIRWSLLNDTPAYQLLYTNAVIVVTATALFHRRTLIAYLIISLSVDILYSGCYLASLADASSLRFIFGTWEALALFVFLGRTRLQDHP